MPHGFSIVRKVALNRDRMSYSSILIHPSHVSLPRMDILSIDSRKSMNYLVQSENLITFALAFDKAIGRSASSAGRAQHF